MTTPHDPTMRVNPTDWVRKGGPPRGHLLLIATSYDPVTKHTRTIHASTMDGVWLNIVRPVSDTEKHGCSVWFQHQLLRGA